MNDVITEPPKTETVTGKPEPKAKEKPHCPHCNRELPNKGALVTHEKACDKNPNKQPKKSKAKKPKVSGGGGESTTPKKSGDSKPWYDRPIW